MANLHLAQVNVATLRHGPDDPRLVSFSLGARMVQRAAAAAPGHVWSEQTCDDASRFVTRSVWHSLDSLRAFVDSGIHARYVDRREEWFTRDSRPNLALWWIASGTLPTVDEALSRLERLRADGPTADAFDFSCPHLHNGNP